jgi:arabinogalactan oligomer/maltooligosaccharide transport system substrate-binding protein
MDLSSNDGYKKFLNDIVPTFEKENNVKVTLVDKGQTEQNEAMATEGPACNGPDVFVVPYNDAAVLYANGHVAPVTLPENAYDSVDVARSTVDGKTIGAPLTIETLILYYNKNLIKTAPTSMEDLEKLAPNFKYSKDASKTTVFFSDWTNFYYSYGIFSAFGSYIFGKDNTDSNDIGLNNQNAVDALNWMKTNWYSKWPSDMQSTKATSFAAAQFTAGNAGSIVSGPWDKANFSNKNVKLGATVLPTIDGGKTWSPFAGGKNFVESTYAKNPAIAQKWIDYVSTQEVQQKFGTYSGEIPANVEARNALAGNDEVTKAVVDTYKSAKPMPTITAMNQVWGPMGQAVSDFVIGKSDAQTSLNNQVDVIKQQLTAAESDE